MSSSSPRTQHARHVHAHALRLWVHVLVLPGGAGQAHKVERLLLLLLLVREGRGGHGPLLRERRQRVLLPR